MTSNAESNYWDNIPKHWKNPVNDEINEFIGLDHNKDPMMKSLTTGKIISISNRALNRTWHPRWKHNEQWKNRPPEN